MPEDYQALATELGATQVEPTPGAIEAGQVDTVPVTDPTSTAPVEGVVQDPSGIIPDGTVATDPQDGAEGGEPNAEPTVVAEPDPTGRAFAEMRVANTKYKNFFKQIGDATGATEEDIMNAILSQANVQQAQQMNVSPEILQRINAQDQTINELQRERREQNFLLGIDSLQKKLQLNQNQLNKFVEDTVKMGIDLMDSKMDFATIYRGLYFDDLTKKQVETNQQEFIKTQVKADRASTPTNTAGQKDKEPTVINTMQDLNAVLGTMPKKQ